jgi:hypothetical protein
MTVNNTDILQIVNEIKIEYDRNQTKNHYAILYSKLAIIEFCGWIEQTFDNIIRDYAQRKLIVSDIEKAIIKNNHGFRYDNNIRKMLMSCIGINNLENIEDCLEKTSGYLTILKTKLDTFTIYRNNAAHTYTPHGTTITYDAPSIILAEIQTITPILQKLEQEIMTL